MKYIFLMVIACSCLLFFAECQTNNVRWVGLYRLYKQYVQDKSPIEHDFCNQPIVSQAFRSRQKQYCRDAITSGKHAHLLTVIQAAKLTLDHCLYNFQYRRWNCSTLRDAPNLSYELTTGTKEQAIVHAFAGFFLVFQFASECHKGSTPFCTCGNPPSWNPFPLTTQSPTDSSSSVQRAQEAYQSQHRWYGCHDNIKAGLQLTQEFLSLPKLRETTYTLKLKDDRLYNSQPFTRTVNIHNYWMGMDVVRRTESVKCPCHGVSGSCTTRTCYRHLAYSLQPRSLNKMQLVRPHGAPHPIDALMNFLKDPKIAHFRKEKTSYFSKAKNAKITKVHLLGTSSHCEPIRPGCRVYKEVPKQGLLYRRYSRDFCKPSEQYKLPGTEGRRCTRNSTVYEQSSHREFHCDVMCCGRGSKRQQLWLPKTNPFCAHTCVLSQGFQLECKPCSVTWYYCN